MIKRNVLSDDRVLRLIDTLDLNLALVGFRSREIEAIGAILAEIVFVRLPYGTLVTRPVYEGPDNKRAGFTIYSFTEELFQGTYSCSPDNVIILDLTLRMEIFNQILAMAA
jgi:hypothetical protein